MLPLLLVALQDVPPGFAPTIERAIFRRDSNGPGAPDWMVTLDGKRLRVETRDTYLDRTRVAPKKDPNARAVKVGGATFVWVPGDGIAVHDGWIEGFDAGEFGGGLLWFSKDGRTHRLLSHHNTQLVIRTPKGIFAVQSLTHMMFWYAELVAVEKRVGLWTARKITDLHASPRVIGDGNRFILATDEYVTTLETDGTQREIYRTYDRLRIVSMVRRTNGEVWIGSHYGLLRLKPKEGGDYAAQWFLPKPTLPKVP